MCHHRVATAAAVEVQVEELEVVVEEEEATLTRQRLRMKSCRLYRDKVCVFIDFVFRFVNIYTHVCVFLFFFIFIKTFRTIWNVYNKTEQNRGEKIERERGRCTAKKKTETKNKNKSLLSSFFNQHLGVAKSNSIIDQATLVDGGENRGGLIGVDWWRARSDRG